MLNETAFTLGRCHYLDQHPDAQEVASSRVYVKIAPQLDRSSIFLAELDTGSPWCVFDPEVAEAFGIVEQSGEAYRMRTAYGRKTGTLEKTQITILADEGSSLDVEATVFVTSDWPPGRTFLGYGGLLVHIRMGLDPKYNNFYFGPLP